MSDTERKDLPFPIRQDRARKEINQVLAAWGLTVVGSADDAVDVYDDLYQRTASVQDQSETVVRTVAVRPPSCQWVVDGDFC